MIKVEQLLCRVGLHKWSGWQTVNIPLRPAYGPSRIESLAKLRVETRSRTCERCKSLQTKEVMFW